jgi:hypothetical protein
LVLRFHAPDITDQQRSRIARDVRPTLDKMLELGGFLPQRTALEVPVASPIPLADVMVEDINGKFYAVQQ